jgi:hypothetical protein
MHDHVDSLVSIMLLLGEILILERVYAHSERKTKRSGGRLDLQPGQHLADLRSMRGKDHIA